MSNPILDAIGSTLMAGGSLRAALVRMVKDSSRGPQMAMVRSMVYSLCDDPETRPLGALAMGVLLRDMGYPNAALKYFEEAARTRPIREGELAFLEVLARAHPEEGRRRVLEQLAVSRISDAKRSALLRLLVIAGGETDLRAHLPVAPSDCGYAAQAARLVQRSRSLRAGAADAAIGVMTLDSYRPGAGTVPDDEWLGSLAGLLHVVAFKGAHFVGTDPVNDLAERLRDGLPPDAMSDTPPMRVELLPVNRDCSGCADYPAPTLLIGNGLHGTQALGAATGLPYHPSILPLFVSFQLPDDTVPDHRALAYLRQQAPIGCRNWHTVRLLRDQGIPAFLSGCLTSLLGRFVRPAPGTRPVEISGAPSDRTPAGYLSAAWAELDTLAIRTEGTTPSLARHLATEALGHASQFAPAAPCALSLEGLDDAEPGDARDLAGRVSARLTRAVAAFLGPGGAVACRETWKGLWADDLAQAEAYCTAPRPLPVPAFDVRRASHTVVPAHPFAGADHAAVAPRRDRHVLMAADASFLPHLPVALESLRRHCTDGFRCHLMTRGVAPGDIRSALHGHADMDIVQYAMDSLRLNGDRGLERVRHLSPSALDRLMAPELLGDVDRIVYLDVDTLVRRDLRALFDLDLRGHLLAARVDSTRGWASGVELLPKIVEGLAAGDGRRLAHELFRTGPVDFACLNTGVMVMDLAAIRRSSLIESAIALVENGSCHDQDALNFALRGDFMPLDPGWNHFPMTDYNPDPAIVHWVGPVKPWGDRYRPHANEWKSVRRLARKRCDAAPAYPASTPSN